MTVLQNIIRSIHCTASAWSGIWASKSGSYTLYSAIYAHALYHIDVNFIVHYTDNYDGIVYYTMYACIMHNSEWKLYIQFTDQKYVYDKCT